MDSPSAQLEHDLRVSVTRSLQKHRPLLHHLNADTSWLLQIPRPSAWTDNTRRKSHSSGRYWYNILIDPWLSGSQSDVASWFSQQWHASESSVPSVAKVEELAREIENLSNADRRLGAHTKVQNENGEAEDYGHDDGTFIDLVAISHEFSDHCHKDTLLTVDANVPVLATTKAFSLIKSWKHFRHVQEVPSFSGTAADYRERSLAPLPDWLSVSRLVSERDTLEYHSALMIAFDIHSDRYGAGDGAHAEAVIYTPHGIHAPSLQNVADAEPAIRTLAFLHGLHAVELSRQQLNLGAHNGLQAQRLLQAKYWIGTHDEEKVGRGLVGWFLKREAFSLKDALVAEKDKQQNAADGLVKGKRKSDVAQDELYDALDDAHFLDLRNGESAVLV